jgi:hypothetical protein
MDVDAMMTALMTLTTRLSKVETLYQTQAEKIVALTEGKSPMEYFFLFFLV